MQAVVELAWHFNSDLSLNPRSSLNSYMNLSTLSKIAEPLFFCLVLQFERQMHLTRDLK